MRPARPRIPILLLIAFTLAGFISCTRDPQEPVAPTPPPSASPVVFDPDQVPYPMLSAYNFFRQPMADMVPVEGVLPYTLINTLFTDHAKKKRFVWMKAGVQAQYAGADKVLDFPDGTVLIKNFYYDNMAPANGRKILETRLMYRINGLWQFAEYVWNDEGTEAFLDMTGSTRPISWTDEDGQARSTNYRIPSQAECFTCHKDGSNAIPIGPKPQNMRLDHVYADGVMDQLARWRQQGYLADGVPGNVPAMARWNDPGADLNDRVRAYLDINCAHCHADERHCSYRPIRFGYRETTDALEMGVCVPPEEEIIPGLTHIVSRGNPGRSVMHYRLSSNAEDVRMPLLGRTMVHEEAVELINQWILSLDPPCN